MVCCTSFYIGVLNIGRLWHPQESPGTSRPADSEEQLKFGGCQKLHGDF